MEGNQKRRWERLRKLLRLLVGRRKKKRFTLPEEDSTTQSLKEEEEREGSEVIPKTPLPPESARLATLSPSSDLLASLNKFRLSTAASRCFVFLRTQYLAALAARYLTLVSQ